MSHVYCASRRRFTGLHHRPLHPPFPPLTLCDKAPPAATDHRAQAWRTRGAALETTPFFVPEKRSFAENPMPKRTDLSSILIIGAGPIVIGQACEFDYSGTQACKALRAEGYRIILVNSNPATIMTDPDIADATYVEPITPDIVAKIIEKERPDALLPTMGGQTALNCALSLRRMGVLEKFGVTMIGATAEAIDKAEDRELFRQAMKKIGLETPKSSLANASDLKKADRELQQAELAESQRAAFPPTRSVARSRLRSHVGLRRGRAQAPLHRQRPGRSVGRARGNRHSGDHPSVFHAGAAPAAASRSTRRSSLRSSSAASTPRRPLKC